MIPKLGISPTYQGDFLDWTAENIEQSIGITSQLGAEVVHFSLLWSDLQPLEDEFHWDVADRVTTSVQQNGQQLSLVLPILNTSDVDDVPGFVSFQSFDDPQLIEQFSSFLLSALERYENQIEYLWIANEIDVYFEEHPQELPAFQTFFEGVYDSVKADFPSVNLGLVFTYHNAANSNSTDIYGKFPKADILGFTLYPQFLGRKPEDYANHVQDLIALTQPIGKPIAITETSWSSAGYAGSLDKQQQFIQTATQAFTSHRDELAFFTFWGTYDYPRAFIEASQIGDAELRDWLSTLSFITNEGQAKASYCTFVEALQDL
ncbi:MAG: hypothetical protein AAF399_02615 [Bacteroidota bacterium]